MVFRGGQGKNQIKFRFSCGKYLSLAFTVSGVMVVQEKFYINRDLNIVIYNGKRVKITNNLMLFFSALADQEPYELLYREDLVKKVWGDKAVSDDSIYQLIYLARKAVDSVGYDLKIVSVNKKGIYTNKKIFFCF